MAAATRPPLVDRHSGRYPFGRMADPSSFPAKVDLQSVATHEMGHATGFHRHFSSKRSYCSTDNTNRETMCTSTVPGQARQRTLGSRDTHIFKDIYP